jgi:hypothetical protein
MAVPRTAGSDDSNNGWRSSAVNRWRAAWSKDDNHAAAPACPTATTRAQNCRKSASGVGAGSGPTGTTDTGAAVVSRVPDRAPWGGHDPASDEARRRRPGAPRPRRRWDAPRRTGRRSHDPPPRPRHLPRPPDRSTPVVRRRLPRLGRVRGGRRRTVRGEAASAAGWQATRSPQAHRGACPRRRHALPTGRSPVDHRRQSDRPSPCQRRRPRSVHCRRAGPQTAANRSRR